jgi:hypothetical protein
MHNGYFNEQFLPTCHCEERGNGGLSKTAFLRAIASFPQ